MIDTRATVRTALDLLKPHLRGFVEQRMETTYGARLAAREPRLRAGRNLDVQALFSIMIEHWQEAFAPVLRPVERSLVLGLKEVRNRWAHEEPFSFDQAYRAVDGVQLLLAALRIDAEHAEIERLKRAIRDAQAYEDARSRRGGASAGAGRATPLAHRIPSGRKSPLSGRRLRIAPHVLREGNPRVPNTHGWLAFEVLRRAEGGCLSFDAYCDRLFNPDPEIERLARAIPGVPNAYQDLRHIRHDISHGRVYVE